MFNAGFFIWKLLVKSWNGIYFDVKRVFHKAVLQLFCDVTIYKDFMKYQRNPQTNLQIRIIKKKSLRGRKDFQCRYVYQYQKVCVVPLDTVKPGLKRIFDELKQAEGSYIPDYVTIIDSLTLKIEGLLRFFIEKLKIPTFAKRRSKDGDVIMEKLFDDIIADLKGTPESPSSFVKDHLTMLKYVMSEKIGWNLRNEVAHSLLQIEDYSLDKVVVLFCLILKLSKYVFIEQRES